MDLRLLVLALGMFALGTDNFVIAGLLPEIARGFNKDSAHTALSDIRDSIEELRHYRRFMGPLGGPQQAGG